MLSEIESGKLTDESIKKIINKVPNPKDIDLNQKLQNLKLFNINLLMNNDNDSDNDRDSGLPPPTLLPPPPPLPPPAFDFSLLPNLPHNMPEVSQNASDQKGETEPFGKIEALLKEGEKPVMSDGLNRLFPEAAKIFQQAPAETDVKNEISIPNLEKIASQLEGGAVPKELVFFRGSENAQFCKKLELFGDMEQFLDYLESEDSYELLKVSKISIHMEAGIMFFDDVNSGESIFDFFTAQQDYSCR